MAEDKSRRPEDDDAEDQVDEDQVDEDDDEDDAGDSKPSALSKANADARKWRLRATGRDNIWNERQKSKTTTSSTDKPKTSTSDTPDRATIEAELREKLESEYAAKADEGNLRGAVSVALAPLLVLSEDQASSPAAMRKAVQRAVNLLDLKSLTLADDGEVEGLDDEIADLRRTYPGLFKQAGSGKAGARTRGADGATKSNNGRKSDDDGLADMAAAFFRS